MHDQEALRSIALRLNYPIVEEYDFKNDRNEVRLKSHVVLLPASEGICESMDGWMDRWCVDGWCVDGWMDGWCVDGCVKRWMDGWMGDVRMDGVWMDDGDGFVDGLICGWTGWMVCGWMWVVDLFTRTLHFFMQLFLS